MKFAPEYVDARGCTEFHTGTFRGQVKIVDGKADSEIEFVNSAGTVSLAEFDALDATDLRGFVVRLQGDSVLLLSKDDSGDVTLEIGGGGNAFAFKTLNIQHGSGGVLGFYGTTPIVKQTSVAVTAAGVHAALVNLGLIS